MDLPQQIGTFSPLREDDMVVGIDAKDIKTAQVNVYQMQESTTIYPPTKVALGQWSATNTLSITLRDVSKAGELTDVLNGSGATEVNGPNFQLDVSQKAGDKLLGLAVADAKTKAEAMAQASGARLGRVISIVESGSLSYPVMFRAEMTKTDIAVPAPIEVGTSTISKTVTVVWSLR